MSTSFWLWNRIQNYPMNNKIKQIMTLTVKIFLHIKNIFTGISYYFVLQFNETRGSVGWACVTHLSFCFEETYYRTFHRCFPRSFGSFGQAVSEKIFRNQPTRNKNCLWQPCLLTDRDEISNIYRGHSIGASYQVSVQ